MPTLDWIGKKAVVNHHKEVPFHLLKCDPDLSVGDPESGNLLVQGDNLLALKALLPYYAGQVKCIYIDPPYNTGNEKWVYNDNVNSPEIKEWLGKVVGAEAEDLSRHDKWLCMMYPRIRLLKNFLSNDGAIFISIDDNEAANLKILMDEIFGANNFICTFAWEKRYSPPPDTNDIGYTHETLIAYRKSVKFEKNLLPQTTAQVGRYKNPDNDPRGSWKSMDYTCRYTKDERPNLYYPVKNPFSGEEIWPKATRVWAFSFDEHKKNEVEKRIWWGKKGTNKVPAKKNFLSDIEKGTRPVTLLKHEVAGHTDEAAKELRVFVPDVKFTPKPVRLIKHILKIASNKDSLILDSFAGSGTTGQAVLAQNQEDGGTRKCILVEMDKDICANLTVKRLKGVIEGYFKKKSNSKTEKIPGLGSGFQYCNLGETLFNNTSQIAKSVSFIDLALFVYFKETGLPLPDEVSGKSPLIGTHNGAAVYLLYNGVLGDKTPQGGNALTRAVLADLPSHDGPKVVYGTSCRVGLARLKQENMIFRQIPYVLKVD